MLNKIRAEVSDLEYKLKLETASPKSWLKTVSAFANTVGGNIYFGVDNDGFDATGVENPQADIEL